VTRTTPRRRRTPTEAGSRVAALVCLMAGSLLAGCVTAESEPARGSATSDRRATTSAAPPDLATSPVDNGFPEEWTPPPLSWTDCELPRGGQCATLTVPLDWDDPDGATIDLAIGRIPAGGEPIGPLALNPGGPGASGLELLSYDPVSVEVGERFDLVSWDPRGVGGSEGLRCGDGVDALLGADSDPDSAAEQAELDTAAAAVAQECGRTDGALLAHLGTDDVARDLEAIRRALGDAPLDFLGFSYGTRIGQTYATFFPDRVRTMVLDGAVDPALGYEETLVEQAVAFDDSFERSAEACAEAGRAACGVDDLAGAYEQVRTAVEEAPLRGGDEPVGPSALAIAAIVTAYGPDGWLALGPALAAALDGDGGPMWDLAASYYDLGGYTSYAAVVCIDTPPPRGAAAYRDFAERAAAASTRFGAAAANELAPCATWPAAAVGTPAPLRAVGAPPIVVVGNTGDPATPYANAVAVADALASGVLLTARIDGHTAYGSDPCVTRLVDAYLIDLEVPEDGTVCPG